jgi:hypothetical protein
VVIPPSSNRTVLCDYDNVLYKERNLVERMCGYFKHFRRGGASIRQNSTLLPVVRPARGQLLMTGIRMRAPPGPHHLGKPRPHPGVQPICLGLSLGGVRTISMGVTRRRRATRVSIPAASETACPARPRSAGAHPTASWIHQCPHCSERLSWVLQKLESLIGQKMRANDPDNGGGLSEYGRDNPALDLRQPEAYRSITPGQRIAIIY